MTEIRVPDIGDFADVEIIDILVKEGDPIDKEQGLITLETDKASMDVPSTSAGKVKEMLVKVGDKVSEGDLIAKIESDEVGATTEPSPAPAGAQEEPPVEGQKEAAADKPAEIAAQGAATRDLTVSVPDIGDFSEVEIIEVHAAPGDDIAKEQGLITLESDKASMDVPSSSAGKVKEMLVKVGDKVSEGDSIAVLEVKEGEQATTPPEQPAKKAREPEIQKAPASPSQPQAPKKAAQSPPEHIEPGKKPHASPAVRKIAREYGVDLAKVTGSGNHGRILKEDIQSFVRQQLESGGGQGLGLDIGYELPEPEKDHTKHGAIESAPLSRIQQLSGPALHRNWLTVPHVTQFDDADVTELESFRKAHVDQAKAKGFSLSPLAFVTKAVSVALLHFPAFNSSIENDGKSIAVKKYINIGIAVDTVGGLVVPVLRDIPSKTVMEIAEEMAAISAKAREGKLGPKDMQGGTFTISSLGGIGGSYFTPIINMPEVAILGVGRSRQQPVWNGKEFVPRLMMPLALSYDHRVIDGAKGARFISHLSELLSDIRNIVL